MLDLRRRTITKTDRVWETFYKGTPIRCEAYNSSYVLNNEKIVFSSGDANCLKIAVPTAVAGVYSIRLAYEVEKAPDPNGYYFQFTRELCPGSDTYVRPKMRYNTNVSTEIVNGNICSVGLDEVDLFLPAGTAEFKIILTGGTAHITGLLIELVAAAFCEVAGTNYEKGNASTAQLQGFIGTGGCMLRGGDKVSFRMPATATTFYVLGCIPHSTNYAIKYTISSKTSEKHFINDVQDPYVSSEGAHFYAESWEEAEANDTVTIECLGSWAHIISLVCV